MRYLPSVANTAIVVAAVTSVFAVELSDQDQDVFIELRSRGGRPVKLAVPALQARDGTADAVTQIHSVLWDDLHHSMAFELMDPAGYPDFAPGEPTPWPAWRDTAAEALVLGVVDLVGERFLAEFRLYDVASGREVIGKRYTQDAQRVRRMAHAFSDEAVLYYTGIRGVASTQIAFVSDRDSPQGSSYKEIYIADYDGRGQTRITYDNTINLSPAFSPQADRIAYTSYRRHGNLVNPDIYMAFKTGGVPRPIVDCRGLNSAPAFSPDGSWVAHTSSCDGNPEIYRVRPDGSEKQRLTLNPRSDTASTWSPNGRQIAFTSDRSGVPQIYVMDLDGTNVRRLTMTPGQKDDAAWQPVAGELIAFTASTGGNNFDIFVYDLTTDGTLQLTRGPGRKEAPAWSPDGRQLALEYTRNGSSHIWIVGFDGSRARRLTQQGNNMSPAWGARP